MLIALKSGSVCVQECKARLSEATHAEAYQEIERQFSDRVSLLSSSVSKLERELELNKEVMDRNAKMYVEKLDSDIETVVRHKTQIYDKMLSEKVNETVKLSEIVRMRGQRG